MKKCFLFLIHCFIFLSCSPKEIDKPPPKALGGILDLRNWDLNKDGPVELAGQWAFCWEKFIPPGRTENAAVQWSYQPVPADWNTLSINSKTSPVTGYATYKLRILLPSQKNPVALKFPTAGCAYEAYINGELIARAGKPGTSEVSMKAAYNPQVIDYIPRQESLDLVIHISNFHHIFSGLWYSITFGTSNEIHKIKERNLIYEFFCMGIYTILIFYHLCVMFLMKREKLSFYFSLYSLLMALRVLCEGEIFLLTLFPGLSLDNLQRIYYLTFYAGMPALSLFFKVCFPREFSKKVLRVIVITGGLFSGLLFVTPLSVYAHTLLPYEFVSLFAVCFSITVLVKAVKNKRTGAVVVAIGASIMFLTIINDLLFTFSIIPTGLLTSLGMLVFVFTQSLLIALRSSGSFDAIEKLSKELKDKNITLNDLNQNLEHKVKERTSELRKMNNLLENVNDELRETSDALWGEMQLAKKIQTSLLPGNPVITGYEISAQMNPADDVGGDYYDIINTGTNDWILIGDVSGHGVPAGLIMMMVQASVRAVLDKNGGLTPSELLLTINRIIRNNISLLEKDHYMTIIALTSLDNGRFLFAGQHPDILIYRAREQRVESIETDGLWIGLIEDAEGYLKDCCFFLEPDDVMLLYTDGIIEAVKEDEQPVETSTNFFEPAKLMDLLKIHGHKSPCAIKKEIFVALKDYTCMDDVTVVVLKRNGEGQDFSAAP